MTTYRTFTRSATNWREFGSARQRTVDRGLSYDEAKRRCAEYNANLTPRQVRKGTKLEFTAE